MPSLSGQLESGTQQTGQYHFGVVRLRTARSEIWPAIDEAWVGCCFSAPGMKSVPCARVKAMLLLQVVPALCPEKSLRKISEGRVYLRMLRRAVSGLRLRGVGRRVACRPAGPSQW